MPHQNQAKTHTTSHRRLGWITTVAVVVCVALPLTAFAGIGAWRGVERVLLGTAVELGPAGGNSGQEESYRSDRPGFLGVSTTGLTDQLRRTFGVPANEGVMVSQVNDDSAAQRAGLNAGDVITRVGNDVVESSNDLRRLIRRVGANESVTLQIYRDGQALLLEPTLGEAQDRWAVRHSTWDRDDHDWDIEWDEEKMEAFEEKMEAFGERMEAWGEEFGERFGDDWAEKFELNGEEFGRAMEQWGEEFGRKMEERFGDGERWVVDWDDEHVEEMMRELEDHLENLDFSHIGEMVEAALAGVDFENLGADVSAAVEKALRAVEDVHDHRQPRN